MPAPPRQAARPHPTRPALTAPPRATRITRALCAAHTANAARPARATLAALATLSLFLPACMSTDTSDTTMNLPRASALTTDGRSVSFLSAGEPDAPRVVFVHGTPGDAANFARYLASPPPGLELISIDRPGFGQSRTPGAKKDAVPSFEDQARAIEPLLVQRRGRWPVLIGHSLGGPIVARAAADYPDRVGGLIILAGSLDPELEEWKWYNAAGDFPLVRPFMGRSLKTSNDEVREAKRQCEQLALVLHQVRCPVIIIHGTKDRLVPVANVDYMHRTLTNATILQTTLIPGEDHFIPWTQEAKVREAIATLTAQPPAAP